MLGSDQKFDLPSVILLFAYCLKTLGYVRVPISHCHELHFCSQILYFPYWCLLYECIDWGGMNFCQFRNKIGIFFFLFVSDVFYILDILQFPKPYLFAFSQFWIHPVENFASSQAKVRQKQAMTMGIPSISPVIWGPLMSIDRAMILFFLVVLGFLP